MDIADLKNKVINIKLRFASMYKDANAGHIGSSLSCTELLSYIFCDALEKQDDCILSKGHAAGVLYSSLCEAGYLSESDIKSFYKNDTYLSAHPPPNKLPKIPFATGSLGHGLSIAAGLAYSNKLLKNNNKVYCVTSDGEINEGSTWEAAMFIAHHQLHHLIWLIDKNNFQGFDATKNVLNLDSLENKLTSFGFNVIEIDGHNLHEIDVAINKAKLDVTPTAIICNTIKGKSWKKHENTLASHYLPFSDDDYQAFIEEIKSNF